MPRAIGPIRGLVAAAAAVLIATAILAVGRADAPTSCGEGHHGAGPVNRGCITAALAKPHEDHSFADQGASPANPRLPSMESSSAAPFTCGNRYTWVPVSGDIYWGGYTACQQPILNINQQAWLYLYASETNQWYLVDSIPLKECAGVAYCYSTEWLGTNVPGAFWAIEFCHAGFNNNGSFPWHCHGLTFSS